MVAPAKRLTQSDSATREIFALSHGTIQSTKTNFICIWSDKNYRPLVNNERLSGAVLLCNFARRPYRNPLRMSHGAHQLRTVDRASVTIGWIFDGLMPSMHRLEIKIRQAGEGFDYQEFDLARNSPDFHHSMIEFPPEEKGDLRFDVSVTVPLRSAGRQSRTTRRVQAVDVSFRGLAKFKPAWVNG